MRFVPKYLQAVGATVFVIGLYDALRTLLGAVYAYPGGLSRIAGAMGARSSSSTWSQSLAMRSSCHSKVGRSGRWNVLPSFMELFFFAGHVSLVGAALEANRHSMGVGVQSVIERLPIMIAPILAGCLSITSESSPACDLRSLSRFFFLLPRFLSNANLRRPH